MLEVISNNSIFQCLDEMRILEKKKKLFHESHVGLSISNGCKTEAICIYMGILIYLAPTLAKRHYIKCFINFWAISKPGQIHFAEDN